MEFIKLAQSYQEEYVKKLFPLLEVPSVYQENELFAYGKPIDQALNLMLEMGEKDGFSSKNIEGHAGHIEFGEGKEILGILGHLDVVPPGDGWSTNPFQPVVEGGKIYARGAQDDKGPVMAAYIAMKLLKDEGFVPKKRVRLILGTDEEQDWKGIHYYFTKEEMPSFGFTPDASFPVIHAEKGLLDAYITCSIPDAESNSLLSFSSGNRLNMVPDTAIAEIRVDEQIENKCKDYLQRHDLKGTIVKRNENYSITFIGKTAHGSTPEKGNNAALHLLKFLKETKLNSVHTDIIDCIINHLSSSNGKELGCNFFDRISGALTCNTGTVDWQIGEECRIGLNIRYPVTVQAEVILNRLQLFSDKLNGKLKVHDHMKALHIEKDHPDVQTLLKIYNQQADDSAVPQSIGGATYARALQTGVAYGALFKDSPDTAHQADEHIKLSDMIKAVAIYAEAIYQLSK
ncbi:dipeptidase PepV [Halobacillus sp. A5]|uniref:dipeptidase PepV n=1 Tax=Halobacillus sp. A5 TaxID=2880263 RepID=UPI0020A62F3A|nr:dipeptidase PepV [Halobacillus sp. A5]MCP3025330.1 dipeptidase PepV [Halobacillus sp. A5]